MHLKMSSSKWQQFCLGLNVLRGSNNMFSNKTDCITSAAMDNKHLSGGIVFILIVCYIARTSFISSQESNDSIDSSIYNCWWVLCNMIHFKMARFQSILIQIGCFSWFNEQTTSNCEMDRKQAMHTVHPKITDADRALLWVGLVWHQSIWPTLYRLTSPASRWWHHWLYQCQCCNSEEYGYMINVNPA